MDEQMKAFFVDGVKHYLFVTFADSAVDAKKTIKKWKRYQACCEFNHGTKKNKKGTLLFLKQHFDLGVLLHECVHAAICYVCEYEMPRAAKKLTPQQQQDHFDEAVCRVSEYLFRQLAFI